jgi:hypothetical protein
MLNPLRQQQLEQQVLKMLRPAIFSTEEPPVPVQCLELREYIQALRRRIEVQDDLAAALVKELRKQKDEVEKLSLDLAIKDQKVPAARERKTP